jgi:hypothetical protein
MGKVNIMNAFKYLSKRNSWKSKLI